MSEREEGKERERGRQGESGRDKEREGREDYHSVVECGLRTYLLMGAELILRAWASRRSLWRKVTRWLFHWERECRNKDCTTAYWGPSNWRGEGSSHTT